MLSCGMHEGLYAVRFARGPGQKDQCAKNKCMKHALILDQHLLCRVEPKAVYYDVRS